MSSERELDEGIKSIKSAWRREHTARANLEKMLENAVAESDKLRKLLSCALISAGVDGRQFLDAYLQEEEGTTLLQELRSLGIEVGE